METQYHQKEKYAQEQIQSEISPPLAYLDELNPKDKENISKDIYSRRELNSVEAWQRLCEFFQSQAQEKEVE